MRDRGKVAAGLAVFVALVTFPMWYAPAAGGKFARPDAEPAPGRSQCVEGREWMIANHASLLNQWRDAVVRQGGRDYVSKAFGTRWRMSLSKTCLSCHDDRQAFCDQCHSYANVKLTCWNCHLDSKGR